MGDDDMLEEGVKQDILRASCRIQEAIDDPTGRLKIYLNNMAFPAIDYCIERIASLEQLHGECNPLLQSLPSSFANLTNLRVVNLSHCALTHLPEDLSRLNKLETVDLSHNQLRRLIWDVSGWATSLRRLDVSSNPIEYFSPSCVGLFLTLKKRQVQAEKVQLNAQQSLVLWPNGSLFRPQQTSHISTAAVEQKLLGDMLPESVEDCSVCGKTVLVGRPHVYVHFWAWVPSTSSEPRRGITDDATSESTVSITQGGSGGLGVSAMVSVEAQSLEPPTAMQSKRRVATLQGNHQRIPIFYPLCHDLNCNLATHKKVLVSEWTTGANDCS